MNFLTTGTAPKRMGNAHPNIVPYQDFPTADGDMILAIGNDNQFAKFAAADRPEWALDALFATNAARCAGAADPAGNRDAHHARVDRTARTGWRAVRAN